MDLSARTDRALSRNTWFAAFVVAAQLLCLVDGPRSQYSFVHLAVMCALLAVSFVCKMLDHKPPTPRLLLVAWASFVGVGVMAVLDVLAFPVVYPEILLVNVWGIIALHDTLGKRHAGVYAICTGCVVAVFGAVTCRPGVTPLVVVGSLWYFLRDQARQDDAAFTAEKSIRGKLVQFRDDLKKLRSDAGLETD